MAILKMTTAWAERLTEDALPRLSRILKLTRAWSQCNRLRKFLKLTRAWAERLSGAVEPEMSSQEYGDFDITESLRTLSQENGYFEIEKSLGGAVERSGWAIVVSPEWWHGRCRCGDIY